MNAKIKILIFSIFFLLVVGPAFGQVGETPEAGSVAPDSAPVATDAAIPASDENVTSADVTAAADAEGATDPQAEIEALKQQMSEMKEDYDARLEELEVGALEDMAADDVERRFDIFGFYDMAFMWRHLGEDSFFEEDDGFVNTSPQFLMQHLNLYFSSQMTSSLSFLTEIQFTFLPNGAMDTGFYDAERSSTLVVDPYTQQQYSWGSIMIQRAWLKWEPAQFFGVKAGYFLTPYGIWHEDHASTVRLSILPPFENDTVTPPKLAGRKPMPPTQLGLELYGRLFPSDHLQFDYAFTVSNGRGGAEGVVDYDDNMGLGLRLKLTYSSPNVEVSLGGYGYYGEVTDKWMAAWDERVLENYKEYVVAGDFLLSLFGVRLQSEYIRSMKRYSDGGRPFAWNTNSEDYPYYSPDTVASMFYAMLAYQLPLDKWLNGMTITPYVGFEYDIPHDEMTWDASATAEKGKFTNTVYNAGINFKPSSFVSLKLEGSYLDVNFLENWKAEIWTAAAQLAVSF